jgi:hypothetical protein
MSPEQHHQHGAALLGHADAAYATGAWTLAQTQATLAHGHFAAASSGAAMQLLDAALHPQQVVAPSPAAQLAESAAEEAPTLDGGVSDG